MDSPVTAPDRVDAPVGRRPACRLCDAPLADVMADLGAAPFGESFPPEDEILEPERFYPLTAWVCAECHLVQLEEIVDPVEIFHVSAFASAMSDAWVEHTRRYADRIIPELGLGASDLVIELASNDGTYLQPFAAAGVPVLGIDPAANVAAVAKERGIPTLVEYFNESVGARVAAERGRASFLMANNVLGHVSALHSFLGGVDHLLADEGVCSIETPHLLAIVEGGQFDTIYHEHFSLFSLHTLERALAAHGLEVFDAEALPTHGGSLRVLSARPGTRAQTERVAQMRASERAAGLEDLATYARFEERVRETKRALLEFLIAAKRDGKRIVGYGAPGKASTLLNYCGIKRDFLDFVVDRNPYKQGRLMPGTRIPILPVERLAEHRPDYVLILPVNLRDEIIETASYVRDWGGRFVVHIPTLEVVE